MSPKHRIFISIVAWIAALSLVAVAAYLAWQTRSAVAAAIPNEVINLPTEVAIKNLGDATLVSLPASPATAEPVAITRRTQLLTIIPNRPGQEIKLYTVRQGDSVFEIASKFNIKPETVLWANYDQLDDNPHMITLGMELNIPPVDGVFYEWQEGDTLQGIADRFETTVEDVLNWTSNAIDLTDPTVEPGTMVMVPGGQREFRQWLIPAIPRGRAGVSKAVYGGGACEGSFDGAYGTGGFIWPADNHLLSGNDYWSGHLGIDIAAVDGARVYAADSGVVVFSGWATGGYGNTVMIDHGNGYQTIYAHLSSAAASCGRSVGQGGTIGYAGSTGNSTGTHLHFEVRFQGGFVNPWYVLPAP